MLNSILLADDEEIFLRTTAAMLRNSGFACDCVGTSEHAVQALERNAYDLIITDLNMPGNQDLELMSKVQSVTRYTPIVVVTAYPSVESAVGSLRLSVVDYLVKPLTESDFIGRVRKGLEKGKVMQSLKNAQNEMSQSLTRLQALESSIKVEPAADASRGFALSLDQFLGMTLSNIAQSAFALKNTIDVLKSGGSTNDQDICRMIQCPRQVRYQEGVRKAIQVLESTRNSFKSRELAALRKDLEDLLSEK